MLAKGHILFAECAQTMNDIMKNEAEFFYLQSRIQGERMWATQKHRLEKAEAERDEALAKLAAYEAKYGKLD